jgi:hypothetical protein
MLLLLVADKADWLAGIIYDAINSTFKSWIKKKSEVALGFMPGTV